MAEPNIERLIKELVNDAMEDAFPDKDDTLFWQSFSNRSIWIEDVVYESSIVPIMKAIDYWNKEDAGKPVEERVPIKLNICTCGGDCDLGNALVSTITASKTPVYGIVRGRAYSAGTMILLSCHKRFIGKYDTMLFHECSIDEIGGHADDIDIHTREQKYINNMMIEMIKDKTKYSEKEIKKNMKHDWIIHSEEALNMGVVDEVFTSLDDIL